MILDKLKPVPCIWSVYPTTLHLLTLATKFCVVLLAVLLFTMPTLACVFPTTGLTETERECCKQMADKCGGAMMPTSHSCCKRLADSDVSGFVVPDSQHTYPNVAIDAIVVFPDDFQSATLSPGRQVAWVDGVHGPPSESPPPSNSILRI